MVSHVKPDLSLFERLALFVLPWYIFTRAFVRSIRLYPFYRGVWPWKRLFVVSMLRAKRMLTDRQRKYISDTTGATIAAWAGRNGVAHTIKHIGVPGFPDVTLHGLDVQGEGDKVLFYIHGGGFVNPISPVHMPIMTAMLEAMGGSEIYIPEYSLAPAHPYPAAFVQNITALASVLSHTAPERLVIAGDSAGGALVAAALAHMLQPSPLVPPINLERPLAAAVLIAPYVTYHREGRPTPSSYTVNAPIDFVTRAGDLRFQRSYAPTEGCVYAEPGAADAAFWKGLVDKVDKVYVSAGEWELIRDDVIAYGEVLKEAHRGAVLEVAERAVHVEPAPDFGIGITDGTQIKQITAFCKSI